MTSPNRTGLMIVRLWIEGNVLDGFRARITQKVDSSTGDHDVAMAGNADDVCAIVKKWIDDFVHTN